MSYHRELPDYSIQQVERAEYQGLGDFSLESVFGNKLVIVIMLVLIGLIYHKTR